MTTTLRDAAMALDEAATRLADVVLPIPGHATSIIDIDDASRGVRAAQVILGCALAADPSDSWVSVTERLPEFGERVLAVEESEDGARMHIAHCNEAAADHFINDAGWRLWRVSVWRPIPPLPETRT